MKHQPDSKYSFRFLPQSNLIPLDSNTSTEAEQSYPPPSPRQSQLSGAALNYYTSRLFLDKSYIKSMLADSSEPLPQWAGFACSRARLPFRASIWRDPTAQTSHCCGVHRSHRRGHSTRGKPWGTFLLLSTDMNCSAVVGCTNCSLSLVHDCLLFAHEEVLSVNLNSLGYVFQYKSDLFHSHLNQPQAGDMYHTIKFQCHYKCSL